MEELKKRIVELEEELKIEKSKNEFALPARQKIVQMPSEVVDSNPYRLVLVSHIFKIILLNKFIKYLVD